MYEYRLTKDNCPFPDILETEGTQWYATIYHQFSMSGIPDRLIYDDIKLKPSNSEEIESFRELIKILNHIEEFTNKGLNLFLYGTTGTGKTSFGIKLLKQYIHEFYYIHPLMTGCPTVLYVNVPKLLNIYDKKSSIELLENMSKCDLLLLDDIGFKVLPDSFVQILHPIIQDRLEEGLSTIYTSNVAGHVRDGESIESTKLFCNLGNSLLYSRTWGSCRPEHRLPLTGRDRREGK